jgi:subtilisin family serine protease
VSVVDPIPGRYIVVLKDAAAGARAESVESTDPGADGRSVHVYVIDTGMDTEHVEFRDRVGEGFSATGDSTQDDNGHGTHVTATVGGSEFGIAKRVTLHPVRVLVNGSGSDSQVIAGVDWVARHVREKGWPAVANMSLGGSVSPALDRAVCNSILAGVSFAIAAGNENQDACNTSPARVSQALTVGATDRSDMRSSFSNFGSCVDVFAPGRDINSARLGAAPDPRRSRARRWRRPTWRASRPCAWSEVPARRPWRWPLAW